MWMWWTAFAFGFGNAAPSEGTSTAAWLSVREPDASPTCLTPHPLPDSLATASER